MTDAQKREAERGRISAGSFAAEVGEDPLAASTAISLHYEDRENPARNITVSIAPKLGSNMFRFRVGEHEIIYCEPEALRQKRFTGNFVLWPLPNRIRDRRYSYQGKEYSLEKVYRPEGNAVLIHGLVFDREWGYEQPQVSEDAASVTTFVEMKPESPWYEAYPFDSRLSLTYTLTKNGVTVTYNVSNKGEKELPFGFALHPYFSLLSGQEDTLVSLPAESVMEADDDLLPTGRVFDVNKVMYAMYDLRKALPISVLKLDHVYWKLDQQKDAVIDYRKQGIQVHVAGTGDFTHCVIYVPDNPPFLCLEYQTCSTDAVNLHNQGAERREMAHLLAVPAGGSFGGSLRYTLVFGEG